jgi:hypothetical protein
VLLQTFLHLRDRLVHHRGDAAQPLDDILVIFRARSRHHLNHLKYAGLHSAHLIFGPQQVPLAHRGEGIRFVVEAIAFRSLGERPLI